MVGLHLPVYQIESVIGTLFEEIPTSLYIPYTAYMTKLILWSYYNLLQTGSQ
ncbi:hypothetical protein GVanDAA622_26090 [Enterococcus faecium]|nr:hypothetical protein GVanDAA622_26090 [Enterococcus faecium]